MSTRFFLLQLQVTRPGHRVILAQMPQLARHLGLFSLIIYGIGDILGAGIYALVGKVIGAAGLTAWASFLLAALIALCAGLSYAELTSRFPVSAGAAGFVRRAFSGKFMATLAGVLVLSTGISSAATVTLAFSGYLSEVSSIHPSLAQALLISSLSLISFWGIRESSGVNMLLTAGEITGLLLVIVVGFFWVDGASVATLVEQSAQSPSVSLVLAGTTIAFFAFIGFEDLANLAEECRRPERDLPIAIIIALCIATLMYLLVTFALLRTASLEQIGASERPLLLVFELSGFSMITQWFSVLAILAITNTGLINMIMASRLMYGMAKEGLLPGRLSLVHHQRKTPWASIVLAAALVATLVFTGTLAVLAQTTSLLIMVVFGLVQLSLIRVKRAPGAPRPLIQVPLAVPYLGLGLTLALLTRFEGSVYIRSIPPFLVAVVIFVVMKSSSSPHTGVPSGEV